MEVRFEKIDKKYGATYAVRDLSLTIQSGALHFLLGPSGCGKTTTLRMLAGLEKPSAGKILFAGKDVTNVPAAERCIGMVFQNYALWPHMTVLKNIEYGLKIKKLAPAEIKSRIDEVLSITQLQPYVERLPGQLSGGQQQRVALARAMAIRPTVLLLDEPLSNLDAKLRLEMRDNICRIHKLTGITTVYVTHDQKEALSMGTNVSVMRAGVLVQTAPPRELYHAPRDSFIAGFIGETNLLRGKIEVGGGKDIKVRTSVGLLKVGRCVREFATGDDVLVSIRPEALQVAFNSSTPIGTENEMKLKLEQLVYLGDTEQFQFKCDDGTSLRASAFNPPYHGFTEGSLVTCAVAPADLLALPANTDLRSGT